MRISFKSALPVIPAPSTGAAAVMCLSAALALSAGCGQKDTAKGAPGMPPGGMPVQIAVVKTETIPDISEYLSVMKSRHSANINPQVEG